MSITLSSCQYKLILSNDLSIQCEPKVLSHGHHERPLRTLPWLLPGPRFLHRRDPFKPYSKVYREAVSGRNDSLPSFVYNTYNSPHQLTYSTIGTQH